MKFAKKNLFATGAAVMMTASLTTIASASSVDSPANTMTDADTGLAWVEAVEGDLSTVDFSEMQEGAPIAVASIDPETVPCSLVTATTVKAGVVSLADAEVVNQELDEIDFSQVLEGEPIVLNVMDDDSVVGVNIDLGK